MDIRKITRSSNTIGSSMLFEGTRPNSRCFYQGDTSCIPMFCSGTEGRFLGALVSPSHLITCSEQSPSGDVFFSGGEYSTIGDIIALPCVDISVVSLLRPVRLARPVQIASKEWYFDKRKGTTYGLYVNAIRQLGLGVIKCLGDGRIVNVSQDPKIKKWNFPRKQSDVGSPIFRLTDSGGIELVSVFSSSENGPPMGLHIQQIESAMKILS